MQETHSRLPPAPARAVDATGRPALGAYEGTLGEIDWARLADPRARDRAWRFLHEKRWHFVMIATPAAVTAFAVIDLGWATSAFVYLLDREERVLRLDRSFLGAPDVGAGLPARLAARLPPVLGARVASAPGAGARSVFRAPGVRLVLERTAGAGARWRVEGRGPGFRLEAELDAAAAPPPLCAVAAIDGGVANATHKAVCLPVRSGVAIVGRARFPLEGGTAAIDHSHGLLARDTRWRWACASGDGIGLNLVEGFNGEVENGLWLEGRLHKVGAARIACPGRGGPLAPWTVRTEDGLVDLVFEPEGRRAEDRDLLLAASRYVQPIGTFRGTVRAAAGAPAVTVRALPGVTEDHAARW